MIINSQYHTDQCYRLAALTMKRPTSAFFCCCFNVKNEKKRTESSENKQLDSFRILHSRMCPSASGWYRRWHYCCYDCTTLMTSHGCWHDGIQSAAPPLHADWNPGRRACTSPPPLLLGGPGGLRVVCCSAVVPNAFCSRGKLPPHTAVP